MVVNNIREIQVLLPVDAVAYLIPILVEGEVEDGDEVMLTFAGGKKRRIKKLGKNMYTYTTPDDWKRRRSGKGPRFPW